MGNSLGASVNDLLTNWRYTDTIEDTEGNDMRNKLVICNRFDGKFEICDLRSGELVKLFVGSWHKACLRLERVAAANDLEVTYTNSNGTCAFAR